MVNLFALCFSLSVTVIFFTVGFNQQDKDRAALAFFLGTINLLPALFNFMIVAQALSAPV